MQYFYRLVLTLVFAVVTALFSGCTGGGGSYSSVYGGYGYPRYGHDIGYNSMYYSNRRAYGAKRVRNMNPQQRQQDQRSLQQTRPQRVERRATRPARNMGRPRGGGRRRR